MSDDQTVKPNLTLSSYKSYTNNLLNDVIVDCQEPGAWAFHCHILTHAESQHGMFGMVTALIIL
jgi:FtsP/CotA-like multicopper oxidase with cupredoxin domain